MDFKTAAIYGGHSIKKQIEELKRGVQVVVGTPGRVLDHIRRKTLDLRETWCVTLDEADRMLDIGFRPDIEKILSSVSRKDRQTLLLSATVPPAIERLAKRYMHEPTILDFSKDAVSGDSIEQFYFSVDKVKKFELLERLINRGSCSGNYILSNETWHRQVSQAIEGFIRSCWLYSRRHEPTSSGSRNEEISR